MGSLTYIVRSAWRDAGLMTRLLYVVGLAVPAGLSALAGRTNIPFLGWLANLLPWWGWLIFAAFVALFVLLMTIGKRAERLDQEKAPRLTCNDVRIWNNEGAYFVRAQLENLSTDNLHDVKPYLDNIEADDPLRQIEKVDFRLPLYTQERFRERTANRNRQDYAPRPISFSAKQPKWLELFQITESMHQIHLIDASGRKDITTLPRMEFLCSVYGAGDPIEFRLIYEELEPAGW